MKCYFIARLLLAFSLVWLNEIKILQTDDQVINYQGHFLSVNCLTDCNYDIVITTVEKLMPGRKLVNESDE